MMMKKTLVAAAVASCFTSMTAQAVNVSQDATGQALLYPYYNVNEGNLTFVSVTNTTTVSKAVKVRFREGVGSEDVFDFTLYLSPRDVWVGVISQVGGAVRLAVPEDTSCTVPVTSVLTAASFSSARIDTAYDPDSSGTQTADEVLARLSEGHIEIIEMAELPYTGGGTDIATAITHNQAASPVAPVDCQVPTTFTGTTGLGAILDAGIVTASAVAQDFQPPSGGLYGSAAIFNAATGIYFPYNATALEQFAANPIWWPQNSQPFSAVEGAAAGVDSAGNAISNYYTADDGSTVPTAGGTLNFDLPDLSTPTTAEVTANSSAYTVYSRVAATSAPAINAGSFGGPVPAANEDKASAVTAALTGRNIQGDFITSLTFNTDWVITFPTRYTKVHDVLAAEAPFTITEDPASGQACHDVTFDYWNREERKNSTDAGVGVSPGLPAPAFSLCYEVNVLAMNGTGEFSAATSSKAVKADAPLEFEDGWASMDLSAYSITPTVLTAGDPSGDVIGLPVLGFTAVADTVSGVERGGVFGSRVTVDEQ
ncbi:MAG: hypothetical protein G8D61_02440 [gamma proteobacterium symbiont of Ctena orbiculata]